MNKYPDKEYFADLPEYLRKKFFELNKVLFDLEDNVLDCKEFSEIDLEISIKTISKYLKNKIKLLYKVILSRAEGFFEKTEILYLYDEISGNEIPWALQINDTQDLAILEDLEIIDELLVHNC